MSHETPVVEAAKRERTGTRYTQRLRREGRMPAVIYGHKIPPASVSFDAKELLKHLHHGAHVLEVKLADGTTETCLVKDLQFGYLGDNVIHVDLVRIDADEEVSANVALHFVGEPAASNQAGAIVNHDLSELEILARANEIPDEIRVDLSEMEERLTVGELELPEGVRTDVAPDTLVCHIGWVAGEAEGEEVAVDAPAEPEVISDASEDDEAG